MAGIEEALVELEAAIGKVGLAHCLHPSLDDEGIDALEAKLAPYRLPAEVRALYRWHDGADEPLVMQPPYGFLPFAEAIAAYDFTRGIMEGSEGWNPLWFPVFSFQGDHHCVVLGADPGAPSPVFVVHNADTEIRQIFPDVASLLRTVATAYANGVSWLTDDYVEYDDGMFQDIALRNGHTRYQDAVEGETSFSIFQTARWPAAWKAAIGRVDSDYVTVGADATVADGGREGQVRILHATVVWLAGSSEEAVLEIEDASGSMLVHCPSTAVGQRELQIGNAYEWRVRYSKAIESRLAADHGRRCFAVVEHMIRMS
ncbi:MAG TPA: SMI1/KNR4 family protein [Usitatibacter sp.]|nr:SMI1/KNR4 family protein [Usitatibacter sp.]